MPHRNGYNFSRRFTAPRDSLYRVNDESIFQSNLVKSVVVMAADYNNKRVFYSDMSEGTISVFSVPYNKSHPPRPSVILEGEVKVH